MIPGKTVVFVRIFNDQDTVKTDDGNQDIQMGQRLWTALLHESRYVLELFEFTGNEMNIMEYHSRPDDIHQSVCWSLTVAEDRVEALRERLFNLVSRRPYGLVNGPSVLKAVAA